MSLKTGLLPRWPFYRLSCSFSRSVRVNHLNSVVFLELFDIMANLFFNLMPSTVSLQSEAALEIILQVIQDFFTFITDVGFSVDIAPAMNIY